jgi:hypothetical protein
MADLTKLRARQQCVQEPWFDEQCLQHRYRRGLRLPAYPTHMETPAQSQDQDFTDSYSVSGLVRVLRSSCQNGIPVESLR